jgi:hypothetical protein
MRCLSTCETLHLLEWKREPSSGDKAATLLSLACPEMTRAEVLELPIGQRDALLLALREAMFGPLLVARVDCPGCSEALEIRLDTASLLAGATSDHAIEREQPIELDGLSFRLRPPTSADLLRAGECEDVDGARALLLDRCLLSVQHDGEDVPIADLPEEALGEFSKIVDRIDPLADLRLDYTCPGCSQAGEVLLDPAEFLWAELRDCAVRLLQEIDVLARTYGWRESDILAMSASRRRLYVELVSP